MAYVGDVLRTISSETKIILSSQNQSNQKKNSHSNQQTATIFHAIVRLTDETI